MNDLDAQLRREADELLEAKGLRALLNEYGTVHVTGSYALRLMTWRDLDIHVAAPEMPVLKFFDLGGRIAQLLNPVKMSYDNNRLRRVESLPHGLYWGVRLGDLAQGAWKIDIWVVGPEECVKNMRFLDDIRSRLTPQTREAILRIKSEFHQHPEYRKSFSGLSIYKAVLDHGISSAKQFATYLEEQGLVEPL